MVKITETPKGRVVGLTFPKEKPKEEQPSKPATKKPTK